jgi:hypothetical protein
VLYASAVASDAYVCALARQAVGPGEIPSGPGEVPSGTGGEAPDPGSPRGEGNKRARTSTSSGDTVRPARPLITARQPSRTAVVSSPELLEHVLTFLAGGTVEARLELGRAALVCRLWREAATGEEVWERVASELMPGMSRRLSEVGARRCMLERSQCERDQRAWVGGFWWGDLRLQVKVWDNLDDTCLMSADGWMARSHHPFSLCVAGADCCEVVGPAFSAASRDPVQRRFASIDDYFGRRLTTEDHPFVFKLYVRDEKRGRQALLWASSGQAELQCEDVPPDDYLRPHLPEGSRRVRHADFLPIYSPVLPGQALYARVGLYVRPEGDQEGVADADKMWRMAGGDEDNYDGHDSFFDLQFHDDVSDAQLASLIRGLLDP